ncbi:hypothetical protein BBJ28_00005654 [Nothophytophthora sp. Chile5]|nr:hypothetical protein BBJ28_00005654 [Nothophytophthora sp. Chile5]
MAPSSISLTQDTTIRIRQFQDADLPQVAEIFTHGMMIYSTDPALNYRWVEYVRKSLKTDLSDIDGTYVAPGGNFWVATLEDNDGESKVVGMIGLEAKTQTQGEVRRVSVHPSYQRLGIGRRLMAHLVQWSSANRFTSLVLTASHARKSALDFYDSFGFQHVDTTAFWLNPLYEGYVMVKTLA